MKKFTLWLLFAFVALVANADGATLLSERVGGYLEEIAHGHGNKTGRHRRSGEIGRAHV